VVVTVEPDDLGQQVRIGGIRLRPRCRVPFAVPGHRQRVDREHLVAGRDQGGDPGAAIGLDADLDQLLSLSGLKIGPLLGQMRGDQGVQGGDAVESLGQAPVGQPVALIIDDLDVVVVFGPVISYEQHQRSSHSKSGQQRGGDSQRSNGPVLTTPGARHPSSGFVSSRPAGARSAARPATLR
jgi:hypothetical protein